MSEFKDHEDDPRYYKNKDVFRGAVPSRESVLAAAAWSEITRQEVIGSDAQGYFVKGVNLNYLGFGRSPEEARNLALATYLQLGYWRQPVTTPDYLPESEHEAWLDEPEYDEDYPNAEPCFPSDGYDDI
jgi:hypothetical protein